MSCKVRDDIKGLVNSNLFAFCVAPPARLKNGLRGAAARKALKTGCVAPPAEHDRARGQEVMSRGRFALGAEHERTRGTGEI